MTGRDDAFREGDLLARATVLLDLGRPGEAEALLRVHLRSDPEDVDGLGVLARALIAMDHDRAALDAAVALVHTAPEDELGHRLVSIVSTRLGLHEQAVQAARESVRLEPHEWRAHHTLAVALRHTPSRRTPAPLRAANVAVEIAPYEATTHNLVGLCLDDLGDHAGARLAYNEALRINPRDADALSLTAGDALARGRLGRAGQIVAAGLSNEPQHAQLRNRYDTLLLQLAWRLCGTLVMFGVPVSLLAAFDGPYPARCSMALVLLITFAALTRMVTHNLPQGARFWEPSLVRRANLPARIGLLALYAATTAAVVAGVAPASIASPVGAEFLVVGMYAAIPLIVLACVTRTRRRRSLRALWRRR